MMKSDMDPAAVTKDDLYPIGVLAKIENVDSEGNLKIRTKDRVNIIDAVRDQNHDLDAEENIRPEIADMPEKEINE